ncbi:methyltransferase-like protein, partial [Dinothrombium tinctorium]
AEKHFDYTFRTGENAFTKLFGKNIFEYANDQDIGDVDIVAMAKIQKEYTNAIRSRLFQIYDFSKFRHIVDVGGGDGTFLIEILKNTPDHVNGTVFDQPNVVAKATEKIASQNLSERCNAVGGSFFEEVSVEGDCYILKFILNDWKDEKCVKIIRNISQRMKRDSKLLIVEIVDSEEGDSYAQMMDYFLWFGFGGGQRKLSHFKRLLNEANLDVVKSIQIGDLNFSIIETALQ